jgi:hypothetical protein
MININKLKSLKKLNDMKNDLNFFINKKIIADLYNEEGCHPFDLKNDRKLARKALKMTNERIKTLENQELGPAIAINDE